MAAPADVSPAPADFPPECRSMFDQAVAGAQVTPIDMRMTFDGATYSTSGTASMRMTLAFTQACIQALAGTPLTAEVCGQLSSNYQSDPEYRGSCSYAGSLCRCTVTTTLTTGDTGPYVTSDTEIRVDGEPVGGPYCVEGDQLTADFVGPQGTIRIVARR